MKMKKVIFSIASIVGVSIALTTNCFAGGMNAHESALYSAASGTFEHEGKQYKAAPEYLAQLQTYLCRDDIELTADQAQAAQAEMYANVAQGVTEGYILPIDGSTGSEIETPEPENPSAPAENPEKPSEPSKPNDNPKKPAGEKENPKDSKPAETGDSNNENGQTQDVTPIDSTEGNVQSTDIGKNTGSEGVVSSNGTIFGGVSEKEKAKMEETLSERTPQSEAKTEVTYNKAENTISFRGRSGTIYQLPKDIHIDMFGGWIKAAKVVSVLLCVITLVCGLALLAVGAMKFQKKKPKTSNHKRRKYVRKTVGLILAVVLAMDIIGLAGATWIRMSFFDDGTILNNLSDSGYYHEAYNDMMDDVHAVMKASGCMENICDEVLTYEHFMFATKNQIQMALEGRHSSATYEDIKTDVVAALDSIEYFTEDSKEMLGAAVLTIYQVQVRNVIGDVAYAIKNVVGAELEIVGWLLTASSIIALISIMCSERYPHRGLRRISRGALLAGIVAILVCVWLGMMKPYTEFYIAPDYLYLFVVYMVQSGVKMLAAIGGVLLGLSGLLQLSSAGMKKRLER